MDKVTHHVVDNLGLACLGSPHEADTLDRRVHDCIHGAGLVRGGL